MSHPVASVPMLQMFLAARPIVHVVAVVISLWPTKTLAADPAPPAGIEIFAGQFPAPDTPFADEQGSLTAIKDFAGKIVILNLWATWCAPCVKEMRSLERLAARLPSARFAVVAVSQDQGRGRYCQTLLGANWCEAPASLRGSKRTNFPGSRSCHRGQRQQCYRGRGGYA
jgi:thiol-disulfide isomerase/thioredoxin